MAAKDQLENLRKAMTIGMKPEEAEFLSSIEQQIKKLEDYQTLAQRPAIRELLDWAVRQISSINGQLSTRGPLQFTGREAERLAMIDRKDVLLYIVGLFNVNVQLENLDKELADRVKTFEEYQTGR